MSSLLDTAPSPITREDRSGRWARFRVLDPYARDKLLREISRVDTPLVLAPADGPRVHVPASLWSLDGAANRARFSITGQYDLRALTAASSVWAAGYLREVKLQFELADLTLDPPRPGLPQMMSARLTEFMLRLPRRRSVRVHRPDHDAPTVRFMHPFEPERQMEMQVLDISTGGCALWQRPGALPLTPGSCVEWAQVRLDAKTVLHAGLQVHHHDAGRGGRPGTQLGCEWHQMTRDDAEQLQYWIARARRGRELISLDLS